MKKVTRIFGSASLVVLCALSSVKASEGSSVKVLVEVIKTMKEVDGYVDEAIRAANGLSDAKLGKESKPAEPRHLLLEEPLKKLVGLENELRALKHEAAALTGDAAAWALCRTVVHRLRWPIECPLERR